MPRAAKKPHLAPESATAGDAVGGAAPASGRSRGGGGTSRPGDADAALTPAMRQYAEQKAQVPDALLLFRMGDFYEMFYEDAEVGARVLGIALTSRDGGRTPLAGIPHHALESYLAKLVAAGYKVAISEQTAEPGRKKGGVGISPANGERSIENAERNEARSTGEGSGETSPASEAPPARASGSVASPAGASGSDSAPDSLVAAQDALLTGRSRPRGIFDRAIVRIVTPGTLTDEALLDRTRSNVIAAVVRDGRGAGWAVLELAAGRFEVAGMAGGGAGGSASRVGQGGPALQAGALPDLGQGGPALLDELARIDPAEVLLPEPDRPGRDPLELELRDRLGVAVTYRSAIDFTPQRAGQVLREHFQTATLEGFGFDQMDLSLQAAGGLLAYIRETQRATAAHLQPPRRQQLEGYMTLDSFTLRSLEIERTLRTGAREGSLLGAVDRTTNPMGARLLRQWLCFPLRDVSEIQARQSVIQVLRDDAGARARLRKALHAVGDIERMIGRLGVQRTNPRDLRALGNGLARLGELRGLLRGLHCRECDALALSLEGLDEVATQLCTALRPDAPLTLREGGIFAAGYHAELDRLHAVQVDGERWLREFQAREAQRTGIASLKVAYNRVFGFYIEVTHTHAARVPPEYVRRQTTKNAERYVNEELKRYEADALSAAARANDLEYELFQSLRDALMPQIPALQRAAASVARLDVLAGWAELAAARHYVRPEFVPEPVLEIRAGRHAVLEQTLGAHFVANDTMLAAGSPLRAARWGNAECGMENAEFSNRAAGGAEGGAAARGEVRAANSDPPPPGPEAAAPAAQNALRATQHASLAPFGSLALITGPNMAGKSTYIRQVALLTLLAHCGCWVPAEEFRLGVVDRIFTRVGAADELTRGQSTFMVEMLETANILHNATPRSLVILDEVGRGTSTFDGLALAWAITEHLACRVGCRTLFATHYHELTELAQLLDPVFNLNVAVREYEDRVVFLHQIVPGAADRSYGLHVAQLAGLPRSVLERANAVLNELERTFNRESQRPVLAAAQRRRLRQLRLFEEPEELVVRQIRELDAAGLLAPGQSADGAAVPGLDAARAVALIQGWRELLGGAGKSPVAPGNKQPGGKPPDGVEV